MAHIKLRLADGKYQLYDVINYHNHNLLDPSLLRFLQSKNWMIAMEKIRIRTWDLARITPSKAMQTFNIEHGGHANVKFTQEDVRNILEKVRTLKLGVGDVEAAHKYFIKMQQKNQNFFYMFDLDPIGRLNNIFLG